QDFINRDDCYFIHYASDGFYNGSSPAPRISCIILYNLKNDKSVNFSLSHHLDTDLTDVGLAEEEIFSDLYLFGEERPNISFIHWNMQANGFGFKAIQARADELGFDFPIPDNDHLFDLSSYVTYVAEKKLSIKQVLWFNSLLYGDDYLDGKTEAEYFNKGKFDEIYHSVDLKVRGFADVIKLIQENKLKTDAPYRHDDGLTREERRQQALKLAETREKMIKDIYEHNRKVQAHNERIMQQMEDIEPEYEEEHHFLFFDFDHPLISMFANWFVNRK
ncbi:hypothetical protein IJ843_03715, partial [bacterium]|nr:hypothetical protein [bacterium]